MDARNSDLVPQSRPTAVAIARPAPSGWRTARGEPALGEMFAAVPAARRGSFWRKLLAFLGPGYLVAVGYMDPGNWATSLAGGSKFGYALLTVAMLSHLMAIVAERAPRRGRRARSGASLPRFLSALGGVAAVAVGRDRHHRDRPCRSDRH